MVLVCIMTIPEQTLSKCGKKAEKSFGGYTIYIFVHYLSKQEKVQNILKIIKNVISDLRIFLYIY